MRAKKLEKLFFDYMKEKNVADLPDDFKSATIYGTDEFHINFKQKTLYIKSLGIIELNLETPVADIDWVGISPGDDKLSLGRGNPYHDEYKQMLPYFNGVILAIPNITYDRYKNESTKVKAR